MPHQSLYQTIFNHGTSGNDVVNELEQVTKEFPYFSLAHFFLLKNMEAGHADAEKVAAKTALHFNNPYLLRQQLAKEIKPVFEAEKFVEPIETATIVEENVVIAEDPEQEPLSILPDNAEEEIQEEIKTEPVAESTVEKIQPVENVTVEASTAVIAQPIKVETEKTELLFEPLYTTDYFASQGIKLSEEVQPTDKLGKQLKSFTDWLKTMKKVHESKLPQGSEQLDASVNKLAEKSNKDEEVITEAMAEAYIIQGKPEKAKDVYLKLSLLNPSKNAYFAAKIDEIAW